MTTDAVRRAAGRAVAERLVELGLTQDELGHRAGVSTSTIRTLIRGRPHRFRPAKLTALSRALGWPPDGIRRLLAGEPAADLPTEPVAEGEARLLAGLPHTLTSKLVRLPPNDLAYVEELAELLLRARA